MNKNNLKEKTKKLKILNRLNFLVYVILLVIMLVGINFSRIIGPIFSILIFTWYFFGNVITKKILEGLNYDDYIDLINKKIRINNKIINSKRINIHSKRGKKIKLYYVMLSLLIPLCFVIFSNYFPNINQIMALVLSITIFIVIFYIKKIIY